MADVATTVDTYISIWNEQDADRRRELIARAWTEDATYVDPHADVGGHDGIDALVAGVQAQFPGHEFVLVSGPEAHHDRLRFTWQLVGADGPIATGVDFGVVDEEGRLRAVTGFLEPA